MKYTPGPWRVGQFLSGNTVPNTTSCGMVDILTVDRGLWLAEVFAEDEEGNVNARLMAAAPEMYSWIEFFANIEPNSPLRILPETVARLQEIVQKVQNGA